MVFPGCFPSFLDVAEDLENLRAKRPAAARGEESHRAGGGRQPGTRHPAFSAP